MNDLAQLQQQFQQFILSSQAGIKKSIVQTESVSVDTRLAIYKEAYKLRLIECLTVSFPAVHSYLGTEAFSDVCERYIEAYPSTYRSIRWFGDRLAELFSSYYDKKYSFLAELIDFEWKMTLVFDASDQLVVRVADMVTVPAEAWGDMTFTFHSSIQRVNYFWNAVPLWQALVNDEDLPEVYQGTQITSWILWRAPDYMNQFCSLSEQEAWALDTLIAGLSFGQVCEGLCQWMPTEEIEMQAASYLKNWIQSGMVVELHI